MGDRVIQVVSTARNVAMIALILALTANVIGMFNNIVVTDKNCEEVQLVKKQFTDILNESLAELDSGQLDGQFEQLYGPAWETQKEVQRDRLVRTIKSFEPRTCNGFLWY